MDQQSIFVFLLLGVVMADNPAPTASISSHVLDTARGVPAQNVQVLAYIQEKNGWTQIGDQFTGADGRVPWVSPGVNLTANTYRLVFRVQEYYKSLNMKTFYPYVEVFFNIEDPTVHYHVPLTLSPYGYSTYRGS